MTTMAPQPELPYIEKTHPQWTQFVHEEDFFDVAGALVAAHCALYFVETNDGANGSADIVASNACAGMMRMITTALANSWVAMTWRNASFEADYKHELWGRFTLDAIVTCTLQIGWRVDGNDYCVFLFDTAVHAANIYLASNNNAGGQQRDDSGCNIVAGQWYTVKITITNVTITASIYDETAKLWYHATIANCTIRNLNTFVPYVYIDNKAVAAAKILDVDYVKIFANRS